MFIFLIGDQFLTSRVSYHCHFLVVLEMSDDGIFVLAVKSCKKLFSSMLYCFFFPQCSIVSFFFNAVLFLFSSMLYCFFFLQCSIVSFFFNANIVSFFLNAVLFLFSSMQYCFFFLQCSIVSFFLNAVLFHTGSLSEGAL